MYRVWLPVAILGTSISACNFSKNEEKASEGTNRMDVEVASENDTDTSTEAASAADETPRDDWELPQSFAGSWQLDAEKTAGLMVRDSVRRMAKASLFLSAHSKI